VKVESTEDTLSFLCLWRKKRRERLTG